MPKKSVNNVTLKEIVAVIAEYAAMEHGVTREMVGNRKLESTFDKELEIVGTKRDLLCTESINPHNLTPLTPSFLYSE